MKGTVIYLITVGQNEVKVRDQRNVSRDRLDAAHRWRTPISYP
jgi:hypothetical protein